LTWREAADVGDRVLHLMRAFQHPAWRNPGAQLGFPRILEPPLDGPAKGHQRRREVDQMVDNVL